MQIDVARLYLIARRGMVWIDGRAAACDVGWIEKLPQRILEKIWIAHELAAIGVEAALAFGDVMNRGSRSGARFFISRALEHAEHLQHSNPAGARRWRRDDVVAVIAACQRLPFGHLIILEVFQRDQAAVGLHRGGEALCRFAFIKIVSALLADALQSGCEFRLCEIVARLVTKKNFAARRKLR